MLTKIIFSLIPLLIFIHFANAQLGGRYVYEFLEVPVSARAAALGNNQVPIFDKDITLALYNPSLLNPQMKNFVNLCYLDYPTDIKFGNAAYARFHEKSGMMMLGNIQYLNYGKFDQADEFGNITGTFSGGEYTFNLSASKPVYNRFIAGATLKFIYSTLDNYSSFGIATDYGISYHDTSGLFAASLVVNNLGTQVKTYSGHYEPLPLNIQLGLSRKFAHMPLRIVIVAHHLNIPDYTYYDPAKDQQNIFNSSQSQTNQRPFSEKVFRHLVVGGELVLSKNFFVRFGYDHQRRQEMLFSGRKGFTGYSWGFGMRISKFHISYARAAYHISGASNYFSINANLEEFFRKGK